MKLLLILLAIPLLQCKPPTEELIDSYSLVHLPLPPWRNTPIGWRNTPIGWRNTPIGWRNAPIGWRNTPIGWRNAPIGWRNTPIGWPILRFLPAAVLPGKTATTAARSSKAKPTFRRPLHAERSICSQSPCGINADCSVNEARAVCKCRAGYQGDPFSRCDLNPCQNSPCGVNAECTANGSRAVCRCIQGYTGDPFIRCSLDPCQNSPCGDNAECTAYGARAVCRCIQGYIGDPFIGCNRYPCPNGHCGVNADCETNGARAGCKCRARHEGDPFVGCTYRQVKSLPTILNIEGHALVAGLGVVHPLFWNHTFAPPPSTSWDVLYPDNCTIPSLPIGVHGAVAMSTEDAIVVCGGRDKNTNSLRTCHSLQDGKWTSAPSMLESRTDATDLKTENSWLVTGGKDNAGELLDSMEMYRDGAWTRMSSRLPEPARGHCLVQINATTLFVTGGYINHFSGSGFTYSYQANMFNMETGEWSRKADMRQDRAWHQCFKMGNSVVVAGGNFRGAERFVEVFDLETEQWRKEKDLPEDVYVAGSVYVGDDVIVVAVGKDDNKILRMMWIEGELLVTQLINKYSGLKDVRIGGVVLKVNRKLLNCDFGNICGEDCIQEAYTNGDGLSCCVHHVHPRFGNAYCCQTFEGECVHCIA